MYLKKKRVTSVCNLTSVFVMKTCNLLVVQPNVRPFESSFEEKLSKVLANIRCYLTEYACY